MGIISRSEFLVSGFVFFTPYFPIFRLDVDDSKTLRESQHGEKIRLLESSLEGKLPTDLSTPAK